MLSDEEKKAIEYLKRHIIPCYGRKGTIEFMLNDIVLNLIEKQSKEIEELKEKNNNLNWYFENQKDNFVHKDKIKAKIEEINKEMLNEENSLELFYRKKYCKEVLQSLFEKE